MGQAQLLPRGKVIISWCFSFHGGSPLKACRTHQPGISQEDSSNPVVSVCMVQSRRAAQQVSTTQSESCSPQDTQISLSFLQMSANKETAVIFKVCADIKENSDFIFTLFICFSWVFREVRMRFITSEQSIYSKVTILVKTIYILLHPFVNV